MKRPWWIAVVLWCWCSISAGQDVAPDKAAKKRASEHFRQGVELFQEGAYRAALVELKRAYETLPDYRVKYNIAQAQLMLGDYLEAHRGFTDYLTEGGAQVQQTRREEVEKSLEQLKARVGKLAISVNIPGARITVDGEEVGESPLASTLPVNVGAHRVFAQGPDGATATKTVEVAGGELAEVTLTIAPLEAVAVTGTQDRPMSLRKRWGYGTLALAGALAIGAGVAGGLALKSDSDLDNHFEDVRTEDETTPLRDELARRSLTADVLLLGAAAAGTLSLVLILMKDGDSEREVRVSAGPLGVSATGRF